MQLYLLTAHELNDKLKNGETTSTDIVKSIYERIKQVEPEIHAYITLTEALALEQAETADEKFRRGDEVNPLTGVPIAIKDVICTKGVKTTCASKILSPFISPYDATVMQKLNSVGAVMVGKSNMDEFAMGSSTEHSHFGITKNPWDLTAIPGGSSGGSAAAVAADEAVCALGSDTGGSIRQPASLCGVVGLKPTYGRVSRFGLVAFASSLDQIGPIAKDVTDCALVMNVISGHDLMDSTSANIPVPDYTKSLTKDIKGIRVGIPREYFIEGMDKEVEKAIWEAIDALKQLGAVCDEVSLPHTDYAISVYYIIASAEASANLARYDGVRYGYRAEGGNNLIDMYRKTRSQGFGAEVKRRIMLGTYALSSGYYDAYYLKAQKVRTLIKKDFDTVFEKFDVIACPTSPTAAFKIGEKVGDPLQMYLSDVFTVPQNIAGVCAISVPCGFTSNALPIGLQIIGKPFDEEMVFKVAYAYEQNTEYHLKKPKLF